MFIDALSRLNPLGRIVVLGTCAFSLAGCFGLAPIVMSTASFYTASATGKFPVDHFVSMATGEDCAAVHVEARQPYCLDKQGKIVGLAVEKQCFNTLGQVQCYLGPDPYGTRPNQVQDPPTQDASAQTTIQ